MKIERKWSMPNREVASVAGAPYCHCGAKIDGKDGEK